VRGSRLLRDVHPFAQLDELLFAEIRCRLREANARADAVDLDTISISGATERQQHVVGRAGQPVHRHVDAIRPGVYRNADEILIGHRFRLQRLAIRIGDQPRTKSRLAGRLCGRSRWSGYLRRRRGRNGRGCDKGTGGREKATAIHFCSRTWTRSVFFCVLLCFSVANLRSTVFFCG
jgi:hypothetical protein